MVRPLPILQEMPREVIENIVGKLPLESCLKIRKCHRRFRTAVDSRKLRCRYISIRSKEQTIYIHITMGRQSQLKLRYSELGADCEIGYSGENGERNIVLEDVNYIVKALGDLRTILTNKNLHIEALRFDDAKGPFCQEVKCFLITINKS